MARQALLRHEKNQIFREKHNSDAHWPKFMTLQPLNQSARTLHKSPIFVKIYAHFANNSIILINKSMFKDTDHEKNTFIIESNKITFIGPINIAILFA